MSLYRTKVNNGIFVYIFLVPVLVSCTRRFERGRLNINIKQNFILSQATIDIILPVPVQAVPEIVSFPPQQLPSLGTRHQSTATSPPPEGRLTVRTKVTGFRHPSQSPLQAGRKSQHSRTDVARVGQSHGLKPFAQKPVTAR